ncbi:MAG: hypothetical protein MRZ90_02005, partial [Candidatus Gastranaerophilales bacterium]|nr:hypothetical protein [Candidatus Gastranaerophilales bacterium]
MHNNMNINPFGTNNIYTNKKPKTMRENQSYGLSFGANENGGYDSYQLSAPKKEESFWEKWKNVIIAGTVAVGAVVLGVVGYNKGWFGKIKKWFDKTETKAVKEAPKVSEKGTEVVQDKISKHLETLKLGNLGIGDKTLTDLLKPNNQTVTKAQFVAVAQEIKRKGNLTDNIVKQAAVAVLERLRKNLNANSLNRDKKINGFDTTQEIKDVGVLDEIIKESSSVPQSQSEVPENETHNESETENDDQPVVPENSVSKDVKNSEIDDDSLSEVTDKTPEVEELFETEEANADEMEDEDIKEINKKIAKLKEKIDDKKDMTSDDVNEVENILNLCRNNRLDLEQSERSILGYVLLKDVEQKLKLKEYGITLEDVQEVENISSSLDRCIELLNQNSFDTVEDIRMILVKYINKLDDSDFHKKYGENGYQYLNKIEPRITAMRCWEYKNDPNKKPVAKDNTPVEVARDMLTQDILKYASEEEIKKILANKDISLDTKRYLSYLVAKKKVDSIGEQTA